MNLYNYCSFKWNNICCSFAKSCPTLCDPMDCSTPGFPVLHYLPYFAQIHVHWVNDAMYPFHPLLPPSPFTFFNLLVQIYYLFFFLKIVLANFGLFCFHWNFWLDLSSSIPTFKHKTSWFWWELHWMHRFIWWKICHLYDIKSCHMNAFIFS